MEDKNNLINNKESVLQYLDECITFWRTQRDDKICEYAKYYIDAFQSVRNSLFGELLK